MIELVSKDKCSGCSACYNACRFGALTMEIDETGFWFPKIALDKCVGCGACVLTCPALEKSEYKSEDPKAFIVQNKDDEIRRQSTSGGAFTAIAKSVLVNHGVVFGAAIDDQYKVSHILVDNEVDLKKLRSSKYVQSWIGVAYQEVEKILKAGREVCFSGTPCQIYGLKKYLGKEYKNLLTIDVMCRAVPSPKVLKKYLEYQKGIFPIFDRIVFRDKGRGYSYSGVALYQRDKALYRGGSEVDPWLRLFLGGYCNRETCHECLYQTGVRASDITLWDCWGTQNYAPKWDDNKGTTNVIAWTLKGKDIIVSCGDLRFKEIGISHIDASLYRNSLAKPNYNRDQFFYDAETMSGKEFINKYAPLSTKVRMKSLLRSMMYTFHLHDIVRKIVHKLRKTKKG
jgi:NAD-dependent dihydropyrimidine dehydrogenase PreA subunit